MLAALSREAVVGIHPDSVLMITLDSCRYDSFRRARTPAMDRVGRLYRAQAPSYFTYGSHSAMFVGFTPGVASSRRPYLNPKLGKLFRLSFAGFAGKEGEGFILEGQTIIEGFRRRGYRTIGSGALGWFDPALETGCHLSRDFEHFFYPGDPFSLERQLAWLDGQLQEATDQPVFLFLNVGETHVPYWHEGASWDVRDNPCRPFQHLSPWASWRQHRRCRRRQQACAEWVDTRLASLLQRFAHATTLLTADHGDCWGEAGLWEHGISHPATLTVPLLIRVRGVSL